MPDPARSFIPLDLRNLKKNQEPFLLTMDEDEEPVCTTLEIFNEHTHLSIKLDERALQLMFDRVSKMAVELGKHLAFQKGAANALRKRR
jgi:hypothetical protein